MRYVRAALITASIVFTSAGAMVWSAWAETASHGSDGRPPRFDAPLDRAPLDPPIIVTGGFGEYRIGHFHAGFDLGTGGRVGKPVFAPRAGWIERVRASGVGYGRSIYLHTDDGRLLQFGHLDAYAEPLASYVAAIQDSSGQYEQDLWPEPRRFRVRSGQRIAWTGESGAGGPHLHFEIRRGDMAYHPQRAGLRASDTRPPTLVSVTLEPLDERSAVEGGATPYTITFGARRDTVRAIGRLRAIVAARDGIWKGVDRMVPWSVAMEFADQRVECRFDSVSWATDMPEGDYVYDAGRVIGEKGIVLWAPPGFRPRVIRSRAPLDEEAGTIVVEPGDAPRGLRITARDAAGNATEKIVVVRPSPQGERAGGGARKPPGAMPEFSALPGGRVRMPTDGRWRAAYARGYGAKDVALPEGNGRVAILRAPHRDGWNTGSPRDSEAWQSPDGTRALEVPAGARFEDDAILVESWDDRVEATSDLTAPSTGLVVEPAALPLRRSVHVSFAWSGSERPRGVALYRFGEDGWEWVGASYDSVRRRIEGDSRHLGRFALFRDALAPRVVVPTPARKAPVGPYPRWGLEARITEQGSGVDARASYFSIDGVRVPSEWDSENHVLRWRPHRLPQPGSHRFEVIAADRAGNVGRSAGTFVLD